MEARVRKVTTDDFQAWHSNIPVPNFDSLKSWNTRSTQVPFPSGFGMAHDKSSLTNSAKASMLKINPDFKFSAFFEGDNESESSASKETELRGHPGTASYGSLEIILSNLPSAFATRREPTMTKQLTLDVVMPAIKHRAMVGTFSASKTMAMHRSINSNLSSNAQAFRSKAPILQLVKSLELHELGGTPDFGKYSERVAQGNIFLKANPCAPPNPTNSKVASSKLLASEVPQVRDISPRGGNGGWPAAAAAVRTALGAAATQRAALAAYEADSVHQINPRGKPRRHDKPSRRVGEAPLGHETMCRQTTVRALLSAEEVGSLLALKDLTSSSGSKLPPRHHNVQRLKENNIALSSELFASRLEGFSAHARPKLLQPSRMELLGRAKGVTFADAAQGEQ
jgi:hypothetical protein